MNRLIILLTITLSLIGSVTYAQNQLLLSLFDAQKPLANAIVPTANKGDKLTLNAFFQNKEALLIWNIPRDFKLYQNRITIRLINPQNNHLGKTFFPEATIWEDPILGPQLIYNNQLSLEVPLYSENQTITPGSQLEVVYQACLNDNCLPFEIKTFMIPQIDAHPIDKLPKSASNVIQPPNETQALIQNQTFHWMHLIYLFGFGLLLSFTPCVLPMLPIVSGLVLGEKKTNKLKGFLLSLVYVLGMALTYTGIGIAIALLGAGFQGIFQMPIILIGTSIIFVILALAMFDLFQIRLPSKAQGFIYSLQEKPKPGTLFSAFLFGIIAALVVSPCTSAPLISVLTLIAQSGDWLIGGISLFTLAIGMGIPLILVGTGLGYFLPKTGAWMQDLKHLIGVIMLLFATWLLSRIFAGHIIILIYSIILLGYAVFLGVFQKSHNRFQRFKRAAGLVLLFYGASLFIGSMMGNQSLITPLSLNVSHTNILNNSNKKSLPLPVVTNRQTLDKLIEQEQAKGKRVLLDFYANWCSECHLANQLLKSEKAQQLLKENRISLIKIDASNYSQETNQVLNDYKVLGFPLFILLDDQEKPMNRHSGALSLDSLKSLIN
ncbi:protein-disulfide reductase DsbD [Thiotrichales bacterium 19S11-10]|nr:protein-disulfide reductase DsbD [Thiotrichales bacterium 19S11-10]